MSHIKDGVFVIASQEPELCAFCETLQECRPYGPGGQNICWPCMDGDPALRTEAQKNYAALLDTVTGVDLGGGVITVVVAIPKVEVDA